MCQALTLLVYRKVRKLPISTKLAICRKDLITLVRFFIVEKTLHNSGNPVFSCALDLRELEFNPSQFDVEGEGSSMFNKYLL